MNLTGYHNLVRLLSEAQIHGFYMRPRIDHRLLEKYHEGLHCSAACIAGEVARAIDQGKMEEAERVAKWHIFLPVESARRTSCESSSAASRK